MTYFAKTQPSLARDQRGVAAVEFALITPLLILIFFGVVELSNLLVADSRLRNATASVADLLTQKADGNITANDLNTANIAAAEVLRPLPVVVGSTPRLALLITNFRPVSTADADVNWTRIVRGGGSAPQTGGELGLTNPPCTDSSLPATLLPKTATSAFNDVLRVTGRYEWFPWFATIYSGSVMLTSTNYNMPRYSLQLNADATISPGCS
jgi:Flp pilus assembly pilin Flp